jgi:hypothetical protein
MRRLVLLALVAYLGSYLWLRTSHVETWQRDGQPYMIYPTSLSWLYNLHRPLMYLDGAMTGMHFHIGPHQ